MYFSKKMLRYSVIAVATVLSSISLANGANYTEQEFLSKFSGKSRQQVTEILGTPFKKDIAVKPRNTDEVLRDKNVGNTNSKDIIEMWYYKVKVNYAPNKFFNTSELTFANDKCVNITFANKK